jgi:gluconate 5-dehydrogenase
MIDARTFRLDGRLARVTGSSGGIGIALARALGEAGARIVLNGRDADKLARAAAELAAEGRDVHALAFDVTRRDAVDAAVAAIERDIGAIDILVSNAGITRRGPFHELPAEDWQQVQRTNVDALFHVGQAVARGMVGRGRGRIVNLCSVMSAFGRPGTAAYTTSKGAAKMLTKSMAVDLAPHGLTVNGLAPGYFRTDMTAPLAADERFDRWLVGHTPCGRWGELEDLGAAVVFLASDAARFVNGHVLVVDGGLTATL